MHGQETQTLMDESARFAPVIEAMAAVLLRTVHHINSYTGYGKREKANLGPIGLVYKVQIKFIDLNILDTPAKCKENIRKSTPFLLVNNEDDKGG